MNNKINNYLIVFFSKFLFNIFLFAFCLGLILNLFEEVEFFKNSEESLILASCFNIVIYSKFNFYEFNAIYNFYYSNVFFISIKNNNELLTLKVFGYSNVKIILIISFYLLRGE